MSYLLLPVFLIVLMSFMVHRAHLLLSLLVLEAMMLALITPFSVFFAAKTCSFALIILFVFAVIEASVGLSVLVSISRYSSNDMIAA